MKLLKWLRVAVLLGLLCLAMWLAGGTARGIVGEFGMYLWDDDLVNGGRTLSAAKQHDARRRLKDVNWDVANYLGDAIEQPHRPQHSWMARTLLYSWQAGVTRYIDYRKPWDDPANRDGFSRRVMSYESPFQKLPRRNEDGYALAHIAGNVRVFGPDGVRVEADYKDGKAQTILAGDAAGNYQPWGKPNVDRDPALGINQTPAGFGGPWASGGGMLVFADGSTRVMSKNTSPEVLRALATPAGNEVLPADY